MHRTGSSQPLRAVIRHGIEVLRKPIASMEMTGSVPITGLGSGAGGADGCRNFDRPRRFPRGCSWRPGVERGHPRLGARKWVAPDPSARQRPPDLLGLPRGDPRRRCLRELRARGTVRARPGVLLRDRPWNAGIAWVSASVNGPSSGNPRPGQATSPVMQTFRLGCLAGHSRDLPFPAAGMPLYARTPSYQEYYPFYQFVPSQ